jgi:serine/threonine-protein kinase RsbT
MLAPRRIAVASLADKEHARREARQLARAQGMDGADVEAVGLAVMELTANLLRYAESGAIVLTALRDGRGVGIQVETSDAGPGIADVGLAMDDGYSTGGGLGGGLPAVRRLMDEIEVATGPAGTTVVARKWSR